MSIFHLLSKRNRPSPAKLVYDDLPRMLRGHCVDILNAGLGTLGEEADRILGNEHPYISFMQTQVNRVDALYGAHVPRFYEDCLRKGNFDEAIDAVEAGAHVINTTVRNTPEPQRRYGVGVSLDPDEALDQLNARFMEHGVGYQFSRDQGLLVRVDSEFMHKEVAEPAMALLTENGFEGAAQEFQRAHHFYRQMAVDADAGKEAVSNALKAVESTAKAILDARRWRYDQRDTMKKLVERLFAKGLVSAELESYFTGLRTVLESGLPTIRNRMAGHGQGAKPKPIPEHVVGFAMHLAASTIRFLVEAHKAM